MPVVCCGINCPKSENKAGLFYRCRECCGYDLFLCADCTVEWHAVLPFHNLERWDGNFLSRCSLTDLSYELHLGHKGSPCPVGPDIPPQTAENWVSLKIMHTNGIHILTVVYCGCYNIAHYEQLLRHNIFPARDKRPQTGYTFATLDQFLRFNVVCKISGLDYCQNMRYASNEVQPHKAPVSAKKASSVAGSSSNT